MTCGTGCLALLPQLVIYGLTNGAVVALNAAGFTLAYAVARQINLAHGNVFAMTTVVVATLARLLGVTSATSTPLRVGALALLAMAGVAVGATLNVLVERLAFRPFADRADRIAPLIASVGLAFVLFQAAVWWYPLVTPPPSEPVEGHLGVVLPLLAMPDVLPRVELGCCGVSFTFKDALVLALAAGVALVGGRLLRRHPVGRLLRAVAQDGELAALSGADPTRAQTLAFAAAGGLAGFAATVYGAYYGAAFAQHGLESGLAAMTAAVLGGVGAPFGALVAGVGIGVVSSFADYFLDPKWTPVLVLLLLVGALTFRPTGLLGTVPVASAEGERPETGRAGAGSGLFLVAVLTAATVLPFLDALAGWHGLAGTIDALRLVALAVGLGIVVNFAGLLDLGYAAFFAIGGYTAALTTSSASRLAVALPEALRSPWLAILFAGLVAAGFGVLFGVPTVRTRGEYLAIVTLAFGEIVPNVIWHLPEWTGGSRGMSGIAAVDGSVLGWDRPTTAYALALGLAVVACVIAVRLAPSRIGRAWAAVRDDETAAASVGVAPAVLKLLAFAMGAGCAGLAGALFAQQFGYVEPAQFDFTVSLMVLAAVVLGSRWGVAGAVGGAVVVAAYDRWLVDALNGIMGGVGVDLREQNLAVFGVALYIGTLLRSRPLSLQEWVRARASQWRLGRGVPRPSGDALT